MGEARFRNLMFTRAGCDRLLKGVRLAFHLGVSSMADFPRAAYVETDLDDLACISKRPCGRCNEQLKNLRQPSEVIPMFLTFLSK